MFSWDRMTTLRASLAIVLIAGCSSSAVPGATADSLNACELQLQAPMAMHVTAPRNPPCGVFACELPAWCQWFGDMATADRAVFFSVTPAGSLYVEFDGDVVSFDLPGYVCSSTLAAAAEHSPASASFRVQCIAGDRTTDFLAAGELSL
jgi:hypothetical protein